MAEFYFDKDGVLTNKKGKVVRQPTKPTQIPKECTWNIRTKRWEFRDTKGLSSDAKDYRQDGTLVFEYQKTTKPHVWTRKGYHPNGTLAQEVNVVDEPLLSDMYGERIGECIDHCTADATDFDTFAPTLTRVVSHFNERGLRDQVRGFDSEKKERALDGAAFSKRPTNVPPGAYLYDKCWLLHQSFRGEERFDVGNFHVWDKKGKCVESRGYDDAGSLLSHDIFDDHKELLWRIFHENGKQTNSSLYYTQKENRTTPPQPLVKYRNQENDLRVHYAYNEDFTLAHVYRTHSASFQNFRFSLVQGDEEVVVAERRNGDETTHVRFVHEGKSYKSPNLWPMQFEDLWIPKWSTEGKDFERMKRDTLAIERVLGESPSAFDDFLAGDEIRELFDKLKGPEQIAIKALFIDDTSCASLATDLFPKPKNDALWFKLIELDNAQATFFARALDAFHRDRDAAAYACLLLALETPLQHWCDDAKGKPHAGVVDEVIKAVKKWNAQFDMKPAEKKAIREARANLFGPFVESKASVYRHYVYHEFLCEKLQPYLYSEVFRLNKEMKMPMGFGAPYLNEERFYDFANSWFALEGLEALLTKTQIAKLDSQNKWVKGQVLGELIMSETLDWRQKDLSALEVNACLVTHGAVDAFWVMLLHLHNGIERNFKASMLETKNRPLLKDIKGKAKKALGMFFVKPDVARTEGFHFRGNQSESFEGAEQAGGKIIASFEMTESVYSFAVFLEGP